ncbi:hypothetical protein ACO0LL_24635 [Undibacterium sp. TC4M20W]|uniref:hypothetical protein n=1 Tax=Undibacterium sp. TC4M20W TaxID=3413052 RepID=UPI003BF20C78
MTINSDVEIAANDVIDKFTLRLGGIRPSYQIKSRPDGEFLVFEFAHENTRFYKILEDIERTLDEDHLFYGRCVISNRLSKPKDVLVIPETKLLQKAISESLTIDKHSFGDAFFDRYTASVTNFEQEIISSANHIVYGRRGAGKSSLLAYAMHKLDAKKFPYSWVAMQTYSSRKDEDVICDILIDILSNIENISQGDSDFSEMIELLEKIGVSESANIAAKVNKLVPKIRRQIQSFAKSEKPYTIFLDDFHVVSEELQPQILNTIYSISRGNNTFIKLSGIEQFTRTWDPSIQSGLQPTHDAQVLKLDLNLTMPDRSKTHIVSILNAHAQYCGLPNILYLASDAVLSRLVLVAAGVPRDALSLFTQAINKANIKDQKTVTLISVNEASSDMAERKLQDISKDTADALDQVNQMLEKIKAFCIIEKRKNSFLIKINNSDEDFKLVQKLIALRLVHVLNEGTTPRVAGERYIALMLDYGFYVGIRAARSVELYPTEPQTLLAKELRKLPIFK